VRFDTINPHSHAIVMCKRTVNRVELVWLDRAELEQATEAETLEETVEALPF
jgi:hypothetical protein